MTNRRLNEKIHERDEHSCLLCGRWVEEGVPYHHIVFKSQGGGNVVENGATLCLGCHTKAHGPEARVIRRMLLARIE